MTRPHYLLPDTEYRSLTEYRAARSAWAPDLARAKGAREVLDGLTVSGLRGRGGAGFPAATKWRTLARHGVVAHVVCNAAEGEPGTFKDRFLLRKNPYALLEGMLVAAEVVGAADVLYIATKARFVREVTRLRAAIAEVEAAGLTGDRRFQVVEGPDAYLFGEERALLEVIEGGAPMPREAHYPPYERGLFGTATDPQPALVQNVETYARVPDILRYGAMSFRAIGTSDTAGPLLFTLSGDVQTPGIFERPAGTKVSELVALAGGPHEGRELVAMLSGVSVRPLAAPDFDTPASFSALKAAGSGLGSAGFVFLNDTRSPKRVGQMVADFLAEESCSQCPACTRGLADSAAAMARWSGPGGRDQDLSEAAAAALRAPQQNRCYLPVQGATLIPALLEATWGSDDAAAFPVPHLEDYDEDARRFRLKETSPGDGGPALAGLR